MVLVLVPLSTIQELVLVDETLAEVVLVGNGVTVKVTLYVGSSDAETLVEAKPVFVSDALPVSKGDTLDVPVADRLPVDVVVCSAVAEKVLDRVTEVLRLSERRTDIDRVPDMVLLTTPEGEGERDAICVRDLVTDTLAEQLRDNDKLGETLRDCMDVAVREPVKERLAVLLIACQGVPDRVQECVADPLAACDRLRDFDFVPVFVSVPNCETDGVSDGVPADVLVGDNRTEGLCDRETLIDAVDTVADRLHEPWMGIVNVTLGDPLQVVVEV